MILIAVITVIVADQASKFIVLQTSSSWLPGVQVTGFFNLVLAYNRGVSFSLLHMSDAAGPWILIGLAGVIAGFVVWWLRRVTGFWPALGGGLILGGALGNVIDRVYLGAVVDFLDFYVGNYHWPAFNLADVAITLGVASILAEGLLGGRQRGK
jgi:signal peptidase II